MAAAAESVARPTPAWRLKLAAFWRWWTGELVLLLPDRFAGRARVPVLGFDDGELVLVEPRPSSEARLPAATLESASARAAVMQLLQRAGETQGRARLGLGRDEALVRRVTMPAATEENLDQVMGFEMDRITPFKAEDVYFDQRVIGRDPAAAQIVVEVAVALRSVVDPAMARLRALGVSVQGVAVRDDAGRGTAPFDLLPSEQRGARVNSNERLIRNVLAAVVALLLLVVFLLPAWQKREAIVAILPTLAKARQEAEATDAVLRTLERQVADYNFMLAKRHAPPAIAYIEDVSRLLPDNTWVQQLDLRNVGKTRELQITGETASSSKLIEILEQSTLLQNSAPKGTVTRGTQPGTERFMIVAEARPRPLPEMLAVKDIAAMPPPPPAPVSIAAPPPVEEVPASEAAPASTTPPTATLEAVPGPAAAPSAAKAPAPASEGEVAKAVEDRKAANAISEAQKQRMADRAKRQADAAQQRQRPPPRPAPPVRQP
jgi:general secretion pathway protein L